MDCVAYAGGFNWNLHRSIIRRKLAIGNASIQVITKGIRNDLVEILRKKVLLFRPLLLKEKIVKIYY